MDILVFLPFVFLALIALQTIPGHIKDQRKRKKLLVHYRNHGGQSYISKGCWERDGMSKSMNITWEEYQERNKYALERAESLLNEEASV